MKILAIETSTTACSVAICDENKVYSAVYSNFALKHSEKLMPMVDEALRLVELKIDDIDCFAVSKGPGSFTGLRISSATVKAFSQALDMPLVSVDTLSCLAYGCGYFDGIICPILDAQQTRVYYSIYENSVDVNSLVEPKDLDINELLEHLNAEDKKIMFCGDAVLKYKCKIVEILGNRANFASIDRMLPKAEIVAVLGLHKAIGEEYEDYNTFAPLYIRKSEAEATLDEKNASKNN